MKANSAKFGIKKSGSHAICCLAQSQEVIACLKYLSFRQKPQRYFYAYNCICLCCIVIANTVHTPEQDSDESVQYAAKLPVSLCNLVFPRGCRHWLSMYSCEGFSKGFGDASPKPRRKRAIKFHLD